MLVIDTASMKRRYRKNFPIPSIDDLKTIAQKLVDQGFIDSIVMVDYSSNVKEPILRKHLGDQISWETHDFRDAPIYAYLFAYEIAKSDYFLHFDADMLLYQSEEYNWIEAGINCLKNNPDVLTVTPLPGPPDIALNLKQQQVQYTLDPRGFFAFKEFTARRYLLDRQKFNSVLPLPLSYISWKRKLISKFTRHSALERWEGMVTNKLLTSIYIRSDLASSKAWTLHALEHNHKFLELLPTIITRIESGEYPLEQAGHYDLLLNLW
ncbi:glycosyltransferase family 2 protein [Anabaena cylindrica FACHB-243]|nr:MULTISPECIES: glycosyltransferase family A protein [Anabaena]MBD2416514.1 glycosyltransferase family 2 protein [Anabaena cylindrica FACHB-243]MBY5281086.1 glycosyltransferase family 2 protein [Anabaena sp. CCAP 1446/1C]MBY5309873.1 glycosyltransferase family 2 protein [Anabaena sp. CCAP 1446/1C]MCM2407452.1 glycosyltransferase family 2 protein [Anabaena sp. CCAP 1446/1C]